MEAALPLQFIPITFFILLAVFFLQKAIRPNASRSMGWGRSGGRVPVSRVGYAVWGCTFFVIAGVLIKRTFTLSYQLIDGHCGNRFSDAMA
jgi:hypothetical protein